MGQDNTKHNYEFYTIKSSLLIEENEMRWMKDMKIEEKELYNNIPVTKINDLQIPNYRIFPEDSIIAIKISERIRESQCLIFYPSRKGNKLIEYYKAFSYNFFEQLLYRESKKTSIDSKLRDSLIKDIWNKINWL